MCFSCAKAAWLVAGELHDTANGKKQHTDQIGTDLFGLGPIRDSDPGGNRSGVDVRHICRIEFRAIGRKISGLRGVVVYRLDGGRLHPFPLLNFLN